MCILIFFVSISSQAAPAWSHQLTETLAVVRQLAGGISGRQNPEKRAKLQSLFDTISSFMVDYTDGEYLELCTHVWEKLASIQSARRQSASQFTTPHQPAVREGHGRQPQSAAGYPGPSTQEQAAPGSESGGTDFTRQLSSVQNILMDLSARSDQLVGFSPLASTPRHEPSFGGYAVPGDMDRSINTPTRTTRTPQKKYHQL